MIRQNMIREVLSSSSKVIVILTFVLFFFCIIISFLIHVKNEMFEIKDDDVDNFLQ